MLLVMNQTMKIREHTWTPVTITEVLTIPAAQPKQETKIRNKCTTKPWNENL